MLLPALLLSLHLDSDTMNRFIRARVWKSDGRAGTTARWSNGTNLGRDLTSSPATPGGCCPVCGGWMDLTAG